MKKTIGIICISILFVLAGLTSGFCAGNGYLGIQLGPEFLTSDDHGTIDDGIGVGIYGGYRFDKTVSVEAALTTASHDVDYGGDLQITSLMIGPRVSGMINKDVIVYGGAGFGFYDVDYEYYDHYHSHVHHDTETETGLYLGGGMEILLKNKFRCGLDVKYHAMFDDDELDSDLITLMFRVGLDL